MAFVRLVATDGQGFAPTGWSARGYWMGMGERAI
jgi:hypothetical protein